MLDRITGKWIGVQDGEHRDQSKPGPKKNKRELGTHEYFI